MKSINIAMLSFLQLQHSVCIVGCFTFLYILNIDIIYILEFFLDSILV